MRTLDHAEISKVSGGGSGSSFAALRRIFRQAAERNRRVTRIATAANVRKQAAAQRPR